MILPNKHIQISNSILNLGAILLDNITTNQTVSLLWDKVRELSEVRNFERFTLGLDLLFILGIVELKDGIIRRVEK
ncbi:MAG: ABC-three component system middle component 6 [bacterium]